MEKQTTNGQTIEENEEPVITFINGFYKLKGSSELYTLRSYAEQAYKMRLIGSKMKELDKEIKIAEKRYDRGLGSKKEVTELKETKKEWLDKH